MSAMVLETTGTEIDNWLAALVMGLVTTVSVSYINRTFAAPAYRTITAPIEFVEEGKADRWYVAVTTPDGRYQRHLITKQVAEALKNEKMVRISVARGALGFDLMTKFEPQR